MKLAIQLHVARVDPQLHGALLAGFCLTMMATHTSLTSSVVFEPQWCSWSLHMLGCGVDAPCLVPAQ
eukprot:1654399-Amphidinium_carterae.1